MSKYLNVTFEILSSAQTPVKVTFYHIEALATDGKHAVIISGGKEYVATSTYEEIWEKLKKHMDEVNS
jgi:uncharacterized protein YlzI (FlbEa/FlbD family)